MIPANRQEVQEALPATALKPLALVTQAAGIRKDWRRLAEFAGGGDRLSRLRALAEFVGYWRRLIVVDSMSGYPGKPMTLARARLRSQCLNCAPLAAWRSDSC